MLRGSPRGCNSQLAPHYNTTPQGHLRPESIPAPLLQGTVCCSVASELSISAFQEQQRTDRQKTKARARAGQSNRHSTPRVPGIVFHIKHVVLTVQDGILGNFQRAIASADYNNITANISWHLAATANVKQRLLQA